MFREAYAVIPRGADSDIVTSYLPFWEGTRLWVLARPLSGFAETFSQYMVEVSPGGGSERPELDPEAEGVIFLTTGTLRITLDAPPRLRPWPVRVRPTRAPIGRSATRAASCRFPWIRQAYPRSKATRRSIRRTRS